MPNWTDEDGYSWFNKLACKRCMQRFEAVRGEVPEHLCHGGRFRSDSGCWSDGTAYYNEPKYVGPLEY